MTICYLNMFRVCIAMCVLVSVLPGNAISLFDHPANQLYTSSIC